jgi:hypothetical protein
MRSLLVPIAALVFAACGPASVSGTLAGRTLDDTDAVGHLDTIAGIDTLGIVIGATQKDICTDLTSGTGVNDGSYLQLQIAADTVKKGTYGLGLADGLVFAKAKRLNGSCSDVLGRTASGGSITLDEVTGDRVRGSFTLAFDGDKLEGTFNVRLCATTSLDFKICV